MNNNLLVFLFLSTLQLYFIFSSRCYLPQVALSAFFYLYFIYSIWQFYRFFFLFATPYIFYWTIRQRSLRRSYVLSPYILINARWRGRISALPPIFERQRLLINYSQRNDISISACAFVFAFLLTLRSYMHIHIYIQWDYNLFWYLQ